VLLLLDEPLFGIDAAPITVKTITTIKAVQPSSTKPSLLKINLLRGGKYTDQLVDKKMQLQ